ncbi:potassium channel family protein [Rhodococcus sp. HNM0569]|uniref:potassium channel family protein n=1 Tax=Rhodococcus sp. HNM0569 TaxID=2716340 RepID=UPI00146D5350|nr:potassium channel family protein [Rhodococcus sp. HNM0569]NLU81783.1 two pore domain potassium channel family protein [Rhodococcus sp. HNM0569]
MSDGFRALGDAPAPAGARLGRLRIGVALARALAVVVVSVLVYFVVPWTSLDGAPEIAWLVFGAVVLAVLFVWQIRAIARSAVPVARAVESLATLVTVHVLGFSVVYYLLAAAMPDSFSEAVTRVGSLYFTLSVFATVGFGDIAATTDASRAAVIVQMVGNLVLLGFGVRAAVVAARWSRERPNGPRTTPRP